MLLGQLLGAEPAEFIQIILKVKIIPGFFSYPPGVTGGRGSKVGAEVTTARVGAKVGVIIMVPVADGRGVKAGCLVGNGVAVGY